MRALLNTSALVHKSIATEKLHVLPLTALLTALRQENGPAKRIQTGLAREEDRSLCEKKT